LITKGSSSSSSSSSKASVIDDVDDEVPRGELVGEPDTVADADTAADRDVDAQADCGTDGDAVVVFVTDALLLAVDVADDDADRVGAAERDGEPDTVPVKVTVIDKDGVAEREPDGVAVSVGVTLGTLRALGERTADTVTLVELEGVEVPQDDAEKELVAVRLGVAVTRATVADTLAVADTRAHDTRAQRDRRRRRRRRGSGLAM
jgi:hypothetical protein